MKNRSIVGPIYHYVAGYCEDAIARESILLWREDRSSATQLGIGSCWTFETMNWKILARDEYNGLSWELSSHRIRPEKFRSSRRRIQVSNSSAHQKAWESELHGKTVLQLSQRCLSGFPTAALMRFGMPNRHQQAFASCI